MDKLNLSLALAVIAAGSTTAACGAAPPPPGTLGAHAGNVKLSFAIPANAGRDLTLTEMAVRYHDGKGITIEAVEPLGLAGPSRYLGTALLLPPRQGFEMKLAKGFPRISLPAHWARLPYTTTARSGSIDLGVGFALRGPGVTRFAGLSVRYRQHGRLYIAVVPLGAAICVPEKRWAGRCSAPKPTDIPAESVRPA